jgi:hypothetical protein
MHITDLITTGEDQKFAAVGRIANAIFDITANTGSCRPQDLLSLGFAEKETGEHWDMAHALATVEINLMSRNPIKPKTFFRSNGYVER